MKIRSLGIAVLVGIAAVSVMAQEKDLRKTPIKHVLLISVDGMHSIDFQNCSKGIAGVNSGEPYLLLAAEVPVPTKNLVRTDFGS